MERIDKGYAIIYIDREGESLQAANYTPDFIVNDYYDHSGPLQWNYYLIIPSEKVGDLTEEIENDDRYTRKYVLLGEDIDQWIADTFPEMGQTQGTIQIMEGFDWDSIRIRATEKEGFTVKIPSIHRDKNLMQTLIEMDNMRSWLIRHPEAKMLFYSHIENEISLAKKKFHQFITPTHA